MEDMIQFEKSRASLPHFDTSALPSAFLVLCYSGLPISFSTIKTPNPGIQWIYS